MAVVICIITIDSDTCPDLHRYTYMIFVCFIDNSTISSFADGEDIVLTFATSEVVWLTVYLQNLHTPASSPVSNKVWKTLSCREYS